MSKRPVSDQKPNRSKKRAPEPTDPAYGNIPRNLVWVFENIENEEAKREDAPTLGAWAVLVTCRNSTRTRQSFLNKFLEKALSINAQQQAPPVDEYEKMIREMERKSVAELDEELRLAVEESQKFGLC